MPSAARKASPLDVKLNMANWLKFDIALVAAIAYMNDLGILPSAATYAVDVVNLVIFVASFKRIQQRFRERAILLGAVAAFWIFSLFTSVVNLVGFQYALWEFVSVSRFFVLGLLVATYWQADDLKQVLRALYLLQPVNALFVLYQFFVMGQMQDYIGGFWGFTQGCNGPLNVYLVLVVLFAMSQYLETREVSLLGLIATCVVSLLIASVAELKLFYVEFVVCVLGALVFGKLSFRNVVLVVVCVVALMLGLNLLEELMPNAYETLIDLESFFEEANNSDVTTGYGISRTGFFDQISADFFGGKAALILLGYGFGSAAMSSISFFCSPFYYAYGYLRYYYLPSAMTFLQTGLVGLVLYSLTPLILWLTAVKNRVLARAYGLACFTCITPVMFAINYIYNNTARSSFAIMWAIALFAVVIIADESAECSGSKQRTTAP